MDNNPIMEIAKSSTTKNSWFVIDSTWGIRVKFAAKTQRECVDWCKEKGYRYSKGWIW